MYIVEPLEEDEEASEKNEKSIYNLYAHYDNRRMFRLSLYNCKSTPQIHVDAIR